MAGSEQLTLPAWEAIIAEAANHTTFKGLADAIGVRHQTLRDRANRDGKLAEVKAAIQKREVVPVEEREVDDPVALKLVQSEDAVRTLKNRLGKAQKAIADQEEFFERIVEASRVPVDVPNLTAAKQDTRKPVESALVPIYDQQYGQMVRAFDTPGGKGEFGTKVFDQRLARHVEGVTGVLAARAAFYRLQELWVVYGGDQVEGDEIFPGQAWQLDIDPIEQVYELQVKNSEALREIVRFAKVELGIPKVGVVCVRGNHGKVGGKKSGARPATYNWDHLHHMLVRDRLRAEPIDLFEIDAYAAFFRAAGHEFQAIHGDEIRGWGGLPFYGLTKFDGRSIRLHNRIYRYLLMGHHHQPASIPNGSGETFVMGDWVGANNLSSQMTAASRPQQRVLFVSPKWGVTGSEPIYFQDAAEAYDPTPVHEMGAA